MKKTRAIILTVITLLLMFATVGCKTVEYVPVEHVRDVYHNSVDTIRDSISHDVYIREYLQGDTIYRDRVEKLYIDRWRTRTDTTIITDSIPVTVTVEKQLTTMQRLQLDTWWWMVLAMMAMGMIIYIRKK